MDTTTVGPRAVAARLPSDPGVYRFRDAAGRVLYVGRASQLRRRVASYWGDLRDRRHLTRMVARIAGVEAVACGSEHEAAWLERNLMELRLPPWNRTVGGQEVPVYIRLDPGPGSPRLRVVQEHERTAEARHFGPYLGGHRVRHAVSALHRVLPLPYSGAGLTAGERDMARILGVGPADRDRLVEGMVRILDREPQAVLAARGHLVQRRDEAADRAVFELAAQLQAEIEAFDWIVAEQRAALLEPHDADVHGWAGGVLVSFEIRTGRLRTWRQRACAEAAAAPKLAETPAAWAAFARRNAELAALLAG